MYGFLENNIPYQLSLKILDIKLATMGGLILKSDKKVFNLSIISFLEVLYFEKPFKRNRQNFERQDVY